MSDEQPDLAEIRRQIAAASALQSQANKPPAPYVPKLPQASQEPAAPAKPKPAKPVRPPKFVCKDCLSTFDQPKRSTPGSFLLELGLWVMFCFPGLLYSIWRLTTSIKSCPVCGSASFIPTSTPAGRKLLSE